MGEGNAKKAKIYSKLIVLYCFLACVVCSILLVVFRESVARIFTNQEDLLAMTVENYKMVAIFLVIHGIGMSIGGALRGMGKQTTATKLIFVGFYFCGHPFSALLAFYFDLGLTGLLMGFTIGSFSMGVLYYLSLTLTTDWDKYAVQIRKKMLDSGHEQKDGIVNDELKLQLMH